MSKATTTQSKGDFSVLPHQNVRACQTSFHAIVSQIRFPITFQGPSLRPRNQTVMHGPCSLCGRARPAAGRGIFPPPRPSSASLPRSVAWETGNRCASECRKCEIGTTSVRVRGEWGNLDLEVKSILSSAICKITLHMNLQNHPC